MPARTTASVEIDVTRLGGDVLPETNLEVESGGQTRRVVTGPTGRALLPELEPGKVVVRAKHIGYTPGEVTMDVVAGRNLIPILMSTVTLPMLDTMRVTAQSRTARVGRHFEFEERLRMHAANAAFTKEDIDKRGPVDIWQMLTNVPGVKIVDSGMVTAESTRGMKVTPATHPRAVLLQDSRRRNGNETDASQDAAFDLRLLPKPNEVHGIEVFDGPARIPLQYSGARDDTWCGMIMIWTR